MPSLGTLRTDLKSVRRLTPQKHKLAVARLLFPHDNWVGDARLPRPSASLRTPAAPLQEKKARKSPVGQKPQTATEKSRKRLDVTREAGLVGGHMKNAYLDIIILTNSS